MEEVPMKLGLVLVLFVVAAVTPAAGAAPARSGGGDERVVHFKQKLTKGFYRGRVVEYFDLGPVKLAPGNKTAPIWVFTNGADGQRNIIDTVPGRKDYTPLWAVRMVTWSDGASARVLRSAAAVRKAVAGGEATVQNARLVVNCPVL
jgi:hypothetical protein